jgi:hypothetical protein
VLRYLATNRWNLLNGILSRVPRRASLTQEDRFYLLQEDGYILYL